jgi:hypothetical protein
MSDNGGNSHQKVNAAGIAKIQKAIKDKSHNLITLCDYQNLPGFHRLMVSEVQLDGDPEAGDIYKHGLSGKWCLHHQAMLTLAMAANVEWGRTTTLDSSPTYIHVQAEGWIVKELNNRVTWFGDCEMDRDGYRERMLLEYASKADDLINGKKMKPENKDNWVNAKAMKELNRVWSIRMKLAATAAKSVVIAKLLNLKSGYKAKTDLTRPWLVIRCQMAPDLDDPETRRRVNELTLCAMTGIYGQQRALPPVQAQIAAPQCAPETVDAEVMTPEDDGIQGSGEKEPEPEPPSAPDCPPPENDGAPDEPAFYEWPAEKRLAELRRLIKLTRYDTSKLPVSIEQMQSKTHARFHEVLVGLAKKEAHG